MSGMNAFLAAAYGTPGAQPQPTGGSEDAEKVAHAKLFAKLAADQNIDLNSLDDKQLADAWNTFYAETKTAAAQAAAAGAQPGAAAPAATKTAGEGHGHKHGHKEAAARAEFAAQKDWAQKTGEADFLGRQMAHAYVDELRKIASAAPAPAAAAAAPAADPSKTASVKDRLLAGATKIASAAKTAEDEKKKGEEEEKKKHDEDKGKNPFAGHQAPPFGKKASALDELAAERALAMVVATGGYDNDKVASALAEMIEKGTAKDSTKMASAPDFGKALELRSLELLEQLGFPIDWSKA